MVDQGGFNINIYISGQENHDDEFGDDGYVLEHDDGGSWVAGYCLQPRDSEYGTQQNL